MKATNEDEALRHMAAQFKAGKGLLSGTNRAWVEAKVRALSAMDWHAQQVHGRTVESVLDIGVGDMRHLDAWGRLETINYLGVDGCADVLREAMNRYADNPRVQFMPSTFSKLVTFFDGAMPVIPDAVLLLDVLYHIPDPALEQQLLQFAYDSPAEYIMLSHATDMTQKFDGASGVGGPGFCWFARPWSRPEGWDIIHQEDSTGAPQKQRLVVLTRSS